MKKKLVMFIMTVSVLTAARFSTVSAADVVKVVYNGQAISYNDVQPQIINDRTMVPIRDTAEFFGMTVDWNGDTQQLTIKKGDKTILHTLNTDYLTVNGQLISFDTPSQVVNDKNVMPVRMLAQAIGADVEWKGSEMTVVVSSQETPVVNAPSVISAIPSSTTVNAGQNLTIHTMTSTNTWNVRLIDNAGNTLATSTNYNDVSGIRTFTLDYTPVQETLIATRLTVQPGDGTQYYTENTQYFTLSVKAGIKVTRFSIDKNTVVVNDTVNLSVITDEGATRVKITNDQDGTVLEKSTYSTRDGSRVFDLTYKASTSGVITFTVSAGTDTTYLQGTQSVILTVDEAPHLAIRSITPASDEVRLDSQTSVTIKTNDAVKEVALRDYNGSLLSSSTQYTTEDSGNTRVFKIYVPIKSEGTNYIYVRAYGNTSSEYIEDSFSVYSVRDYISGVTTNDRIYDYSIDTTNRDTYGMVEITVETSMDVIGITIHDSNDIYSTTLYNENTNGSIKTWKGTFSVSTYYTSTFFLYYDNSYNERDHIVFNIQ